MFFSSLFSFGSILAHQTSSGMFSEWVLFIWHPWGPWGRVNSREKGFSGQTATVFIWQKKSKKSGWYKKLPVPVMSDWTILDPPALYLTVLFKLWPKNMQRWQFVPNDSAPHSDGRIVKKQETHNLCLNRKRESINDVNSVSSKDKSPVVPFHGITSQYSLFKEIWIFAPDKNAVLFWEKDCFFVGYLSSFLAVHRTLRLQKCHCFLP